MSKLIFKKILQDRPKVLTAFVRSGLRKRDVQFIEEMIEHDDDDFRPEVIIIYYIMHGHADGIWLVCIGTI